MKLYNDRDFIAVNWFQFNWHQHECDTEMEALCAITLWTHVFVIYKFYSITDRNLANDIQNGLCILLKAAVGFLIAHHSYLNSSIVRE